MVCIPHFISFTEDLWLTFNLGSTLASTGDNGKVHMWRESVGGNYTEFAETGPA